MNWKLILGLSIFGIAMGCASLFGLTRNIEPILWLIIFIFYAVWIAKRARGNHFLHGFLVSLINGIWISLIHFAFFDMFAENNPEMIAKFGNLPPSVSLRLMVLLVGPIVGAVFGVVAGLFALLAGKLPGDKSAQPTPGGPA
jgi:hypothetical protein